MHYGTVAGIDLPVSRLVQGTTPFNLEDLDYCFALLDGVFARGCNTFDTAHVYGGGECDRILGKWIAERGIRQKVVVLAKGAHHNADRRRVTPFDIASDLHDTLARMKTNYIDLYVLHRDDPEAPVGPIVEALNEHRAAGRIRAFGGSNWSHERLAAANAYAAAHGLVPFAASSPHFSLAQQVAEPWENCISIAGHDCAPARAWYEHMQMPVFAWSSLSNGFFSGRYTRADIEAFPDDSDEQVVRCYKCAENLARLDRTTELASKKGVTVPQLALAYLLRQPLNVFALVGCQSAEEMAANEAAFDVPLTTEELAWLDLRTV